MDRGVVSEVNVFLAGYSSLGIAESFKAPAVKYKKLKQNGAVGERSVVYGAVESLDSEAKFKSMPKALYEEMAKLNDAEIIFKKAVVIGNETIAYEWTCKGSFDMEYGESKPGEFLDVKITQKGMKAYTHEIGNKVVVDIDFDNIKCEINGKDLLAETRAIVQG